MSSPVPQPGRFAALLEAGQAVHARPGRIVTDGCRLAWDDQTIAVFITAEAHNFTLGADRPFVMRVARTALDGESHLRVEFLDAEREAVALRAPCPADRVAGLPVESGAAIAFPVELEPLTDLLSSALAMGARVAVNAAHADELRQGLPEVSLAAQVAARCELEPERPELDPTLSLEEVAARAAAAERERLRRMEAKRATVPARHGQIASPRTPHSADAQSGTARLEARIAELQARVAELEAENEALAARAREPGRVLDVVCPSCDAFGGETPLRLAPVARPERARGLAAICERCGWLGVVVVSRGGE